MVIGFWWEMLDRLFGKNGRLFLIVKEINRSVINFFKNGVKKCKCYGMRKEFWWKFKWIETIELLFLCRAS